MPGIPLLNLGYGLGGLAQGFQSAQSQGLQQALQRLALQQAKSQQNAQSLAGLALQAGLLNQRGGGGPLQPINVSAPGSAAAAPQAPAIPQTPEVPQVAKEYPQQSYTPPSPFSLGDMRQAMSRDDDDPLPAYAPGPAQPDLSQAPPPQQQQPAPASPQQQPPAKTDDDTSSAPAPKSDTSTAPASGGGGVAAVFPSGQSIDISSMFKTIDYQQLARGIAQLAPPGTSQADIYAAVTDLAKLADGDKVQQQQAGLIARTLLGGQFKLANTEMTTAAAQKRTETTVAGAGERTDKQQAGATQREREAAASRERIAEANRESREKIAEGAQQIRRDAMNIRNANDQARIQQSAQRIAQAAQNAGRAEIALQIQSISRQISTIKPQPDGSFTDLQQQQLKTFSDRIAALAARAAGATTPSGP